MIVVDLDGTILNEESKVSSTTSNYLKELKDRGFIITIATGRTLKPALSATEGANFANYIITDSGSGIYNMIDGKAILKRIITRKITEKILGYYGDTFNFINVCDTNNVYKYTYENITSSIFKITSDKDFILNSCKEITHITIAMKNNKDLLNMYNKLKIELKDVDIIIMQDSFASNKWLDIVPKGCNKYKAIQNLASYLNIKNEEIIAFGDGINDIEMIENCGFGVSLQNALL